MDLLIARPDGDFETNLDDEHVGAVAELWRTEDGFWYAEIRIPAPAD